LLVLKIESLLFVCGFWFVGLLVKVGKKMVVPLTASLYVHGTPCSNGVLLILVLYILWLVFYDNKKK
jgi:hypothetical protein